MGERGVFFSDFEELQFENFDDVPVVFDGFGHSNLIITR